MPESLEDTIRTISGMVDIMVVRVGLAIDRGLIASCTEAPLINGGDEGLRAEHPSQALIDLLAIEDQGPVADLSIAICGDIRMRSVRSLLSILAHRPPRRLVLVTANDLGDTFTLPGPLQSIVESRTVHQLADIDVLYVTGMHHGTLPERQRSLLRVDAKSMRALPSRAIVLSPLPILDEITSDIRADPRIRMFSQSDDGVAVRMALLEEMTHGLPG